MDRCDQVAILYFNRTATKAKIYELTSGQRAMADLAPVSILK